MASGNSIDIVLIWCWVQIGYVAGFAFILFLYGVGYGFDMVLVCVLLVVWYGVGMFVVLFGYGRLANLVVFENVLGMG